MLKSISKKNTFIVAVLALAMMFCMSFGVSAAPLYSNNDIEYLVGNSSDYETDGDISVTVKVFSKQVNGTALNMSDEVTIVGDGETSKAYTVRDVMEAWAAENNVTFTTSVWDSTLYQSVEQPYVNGSSTYIFSMTKDGVKYAPASTSAYDGFKFRVNSQIPQLSAGWGATIDTTYVNDGDVVTYYYDNPVSEADAADFIRIYEVANDADSIQVTVQRSFDWFMTESPWTTTMADFAAVADIPVVVKKAGVQVGTGTTNANGIADITITNGVTAGNYTIEVAPAWKTSGLLDRTGDSEEHRVQ